MWFGYSVLFLLAVLTPIIIREDIFGIREEPLESTLLFVNGCIAFALYAWKDRMVLRYIREKLSLEREKHDITKDLSESYSYIGEVNRKVDMLQELLGLFPAMMTAFQDGRQGEIYHVLKERTKTMLQSEDFALRVVNVETGNVEKELYIHQGSCAAQQVDIAKIAQEDRQVLEVENCKILRGKEHVGLYRAYLIFLGTRRDMENVEMLQAILTELLSFFVLEEAYRRCFLESSSQTHETNRH